METTKQNKHIEVVISSLSGLNIMSLESCQEICNVLKDHYEKVGTTVIKKKEDLEKLVQKKPDLVFSGIKYVGFTKSSLLRDSKNKIWFSEYLDSKGINHTGSKVEALKLEFDKVLAKKVIQKNNINTSNFFVAKPGQYKKDVELPMPFPLFIKPIYEGSGKGVGADSLVSTFEEFEKKVESIYKEFKNACLVEKYLSGREFTVGIFDAANGKKTAMPVEMIAVADSLGNKILTYEAKKDDDERLVPVEDSREFKRLSTFAKKAFTALGARDYGRIDIRMDARGELYFLEANLLPGLNPRKSYFIKTCKRNSSASYEQILLRIVEIALKRG